MIVRRHYFDSTKALCLSIACNSKIVNFVTVFGQIGCELTTRLVYLKCEITANETSNTPKNDTLTYIFQVKLIYI